MSSKFASANDEWLAGTSNNDDDDDSVWQVKIVVLGDSSSGKTALVRRFVSGTFGDSPSTITIAFETKKLLMDNKRVKLTIWDTAGQEKYRSLAPVYYRGADAAVIVYDISRKESFENVSYWLRELQGNSNKSPVICIVGTKADLEDQQEVPTTMGSEIARQSKAIFFEASAQTGANVDALFQQLTQEALQKCIPPPSHATNFSDPTDCPC